MKSASGGSGRKTGAASARQYGAAVMLALGIAVATGHGTAWADTGTEGQGAAGSSQSAGGHGTAGRPKSSPSADRTDSPPTAATAGTKNAGDGHSTAVGSRGTAATRQTITVAQHASPARPGALTQRSASARQNAFTATVETSSSTTAPRSPSTAVVVASPTPAGTGAAELATADPQPPIALVVTAPDPPGPVAPIADVAALPARIANAVFQLFGVTTSAGRPISPISPAPVEELVYAVFRRLEGALGLETPVTDVPVPPKLTYSGPLTRPTPTVTQFLNAATTSYVLGGTPGGMRPFTVDGWPMASTESLTGMSAQVWVTPQSQIIIAYSGTSGGTNALFNPLMAVTGVFTDFQAAFTDTTPEAFNQALRFAQRVQTEAAKQGYAADSVFVTGHSLGAWEAQYVSQQIGLAGIGFEGPGLSSTVPGNGVDALFVNTASYGDIAPYLASDLPALQPFAPPYVPAGGLKPHYGPIVLLGDPDANIPIVNASRLWGTSVAGNLIAVITLLGNFAANHLTRIQAYNLDVDLDPTITPWLGVPNGPILTGFGELTIPEFLQAASDAGILVRP